MKFNNLHSEIRGSDLVHLAQRRKGLKYLRLSGKAAWDNLADSHIALIASHLKDLAFFNFAVNSDRPLVTIQSLKSLGTHCRKLSTCEIACELELEDL